MKRKPVPLTDTLIQGICTRVRAGAFEHVAAGSLGVPLTTFEAWLRQGQRQNGALLKRRLVRELQAARAHARFMAEMEMRRDDPKCWLLHGPGKETPTAPGWSALARAAAQSDRDGLPLLQRAEFAGLARLLMKLLAPYPEARVAVADGLAGLEELPVDPAPPVAVPDAPPPDPAAD